MAVLEAINAVANRDNNSSPKRHQIDVLEGPRLGGPCSGAGSIEGGSGAACSAARRD